MNQFEIHIWKADGLRAADFMGKSDAYAIVYCGDEEVGRTHIIKQNLYPKWARSFQIPVAVRNEPVIVEVGIPGQSDFSHYLCPRLRPSLDL